MIVTLSALSPAAGKCVFRLMFANESNDSSALPLNAIQRNGASVGLHFFLQGSAVKPIERAAVTPKFVVPQAIIPANQKAIVEFEANVNEKASGIYDLAFKDVTYQVAAGRRYQVQFAWHDWSSNTIDWSIG